MVTRGRGRALLTRPSIATVIPYNRGRCLPECLGVVLPRETVGTSFVIVDGASPDGTLAVGRSLADSGPEDQVIGHRVNQRHLAICYEGVRAATGGCLVLRSADELPTLGCHRDITAADLGGDAPAAALR
jgi:hypothetical protein